MCFYIHRDHEKKKTATKDIVCYKRLEVANCILISEISNKNLAFVRFETPYRHKRIHLEKKPLVKSPIGRVIKFYEIEKGLHSYSCKKKALKRADRWEVVVKCVIPKGAKYYYNPYYKEYVSNRLQYTKLITSRKSSPFTIAKSLQIK